MKKTLNNLGAFFTLALLVFAIVGCSNPAGGSPPSAPPPPYIITGSSGAFTAAHEDGTTIAAGQPIQDLINAIRTDAAGRPVTIQFGSGDDVLNVGNVGTGIVFDNSGGTWGPITLRGSVTRSGGDNPTFLLTNVSITSTINIGVSAQNNGGFRLEGSANLTITEGTLNSQESLNGAVHHNSTGLLTISGGILSSSSLMGTIWLENVESRMIMSGGTVRSTTNAPNGTAIQVSSTLENAVIISGGTVGSMNGSSVHEGEITEFLGVAIRNMSTGGVTIRGTALITSRAQSAGTIRLNNTSGGTLTIEGSATVRNWNPGTSNSAGEAIIVIAADNEARKARVTHTSGTISPMPDWLE